MHVGLVDFLTKNGTPGTNSLLVLFFILFFLYFLVMPGGASEGPAGLPTLQSVRNALQCVKLIGVWRATSKNRQHDWLRGMVNFKDASHSTSSSSSAHKSLSAHAMRKRNSPSYSSCSPLSICMHCMSWSKRRAEKVDRMVNIWTRLATGVGAARPPARRPRRGRRRALSAAAQTRKRGGGACDGAGKT